MQYMLREQSIGKSVSRLGIVVGVHIVLGAALIATLNRAPSVSIAPPPISVLNPAQPPKPIPPETPREIAKANLSTVQPINVPIPRFHGGSSAYCRHHFRHAHADYSIRFA